MKLKELTEAVAAACGMNPRAVNTVQVETFRLMRAALEKGERVTIPEFGVFTTKTTVGNDGEVGKKVVRFRAKSDEGGGKTEDEIGKKKRERREARKNKEESRTSAGDSTVSAAAPSPADTSEKK